jgi:hypothetical protein
MSNDNGCNGTCVDVDGSYSCTNGCLNGYDLDEDNMTMKRECKDKKECDTDNGGCRQICRESPGSYYCECSQGYTLDSDNHNCSDVDECNTTHDCEHNCTNKIGTYECSCRDGYLLNADRRTCTERAVYCQETPYFNPLSFIPLVIKPINIEGDDNISPQIYFRDFLVGCRNFTNVYVGTNGYFTFDNFTGFTPFQFARGNGLSLVAPFFTDIGDTTDASGRIKYEAHDDSTFEVAESVNGIIRREKDPNFCGKQFLIASWEEVSPYSNPNIKITFQGILATNQRKTYAIFTYKCDGNKFPVKPTVGYVTEDGMVFNYEATLQNNPLQNNPYQIICNSTTDEYVNIVLKISESECKPAFDDCKQE